MRREGEEEMALNNSMNFQREKSERMRQDLIL